MSYRSWHAYGFGINPQDIDINRISDETLIQFIMQAPVFYDKCKKDLMEFTGKAENELVSEDFLEYEVDIGYCGLGALMWAVMNEREHIYFSLFESYDGIQFLMYTQTYPWVMSSFEKAMTEDGLRGIYKKYISQLTDEDIVIDYHSCENGG